jgi:hypothetical protein
MFGYGFLSCILHLFLIYPVISIHIRVDNTYQRYPLTFHSYPWLSMCIHLYPFISIISIISIYLIQYPVWSNIIHVHPWYLNISIRPISCMCNIYIPIFLCISTCNHSYPVRLRYQHLTYFILMRPFISYQYPFVSYYIFKTLYTQVHLHQHYVSCFIISILAYTDVSCNVYTEHQ